MTVPTREGRGEGRRRGRLARALGILGPSWRAAPLRRTAQAASLALYMVLFLWVAWPRSEAPLSEALAGKEFLPAELFLLLDPLAGLSTAVAARAAGAAVVWTVASLLASAVVPRWFCGYACPLGTLIDIFDGLVGRRVRRFRLKSRRGPAGARFVTLTVVLAAAAGGTLLAGHVAAIPLMNRGLVASLGALEVGLLRHWDLAPPLTLASALAVALLAVTLLLGLLGRRFWCRCLCPTGALLSLAGRFGIVTRRVGGACTSCGRCEAACPFGAAGGDGSSRPLACATCGTCAGVCPEGAVTFAAGPPWRSPTPGAPKGERASAPGGGRAGREPPLASRRAFVLSALGGLGAAAVLRTETFLGSGPDAPPLRPPGSAPEARFGRLCVRCGECVKVCPGGVLRPAGLESGLGNLWTPVATFVRAGCHHECNLCTQVCPTGAIRPLALEEKRAVRMGLARVDTQTCLPHRGVEECRACADACDAAGYRAVEMRHLRLEIGEVPEGVLSAMEIEEMSTILAPYVRAEACVGCGQCENRCHAAHVARTGRLAASAIAVAPLAR